MEKIRIHNCYCGIPKEKLRELVQKRFVDHIPTEQLMREMPSQEERESLAAVALLDVKEEDLKEMVETEDPSLFRHLFDCRRHVREILANEGLKIQERESDDG